MSLFQTLVQELCEPLTEEERDLFGNSVRPPQWFFIERNLILDTLWRIIRMARKDNNSYGNYTSDITFCEVQIPHEKKAEAKSKAAEIIADMERYLDAFLTEGYKMSIRWDGQNMCYIASFTCDANKHPNNKKCLISRSDNWLEAIALNIYKTSHLCPHGVWPERVQSSTWG